MVVVGVKILLWGTGVATGATATVAPPLGAETGVETGAGEEPLLLGAGAGVVGEVTFATVPTPPPPPPEEPPDEDVGVVFGGTTALTAAGAVAMAWTTFQIDISPTSACRVC